MTTEKSTHVDYGHSATFDSLALEILLGILSYLPNLETLYNLISACPRSWRLFQDNAPALFEASLSGPDCDNLLACPIRDLIRAVVLVRTGRLPFPTLDAFHYDFINSKFFCQHPSQRLGLIEGPETSFDPAVLRSVLRAHCDISGLTYACLGSYLARIRAAEFQPQYCPDAMYTFGCGPSDLEWLPAWKRSFEGRPVGKEDAGSPSWVEEMRVRRALWLLQLIGDLQQVARDEYRVGSLLWSAEDVQRLLKMKPEEFVEPRILTGTPYRGWMEEVISVEDYLRDLPSYHELSDVPAKVLPTRYYQLPHLSARLMSNILATPQPEAEELLVGGAALPFNKSKALIKSRFRELYRQKRSLEYTGARLWGRTRSSLFEVAPGVLLWLGLTSTSGLRLGIRCAWPKATEHNTPLSGVKFDSFRRLGFAIWDRKRMHLLGLVHGADNKYDDEQRYYFTWESLLSSREVASVKAALGDPYPNGFPYCGSDAGDGQYID